VLGALSQSHTTPSTNEASQQAQISPPAAPVHTESSGEQGDSSTSAPVQVVGLAGGSRNGELV
jgi:hypothetical protein